MVESLSPQHLRLFIAIAVPDLVKAQIKTTQDQFRMSLERGVVRWTKPDQYHLTLRFLGRMEAGLVEPLVDALRAVCRSAPSLQLRASGISFFPNARMPRVVWIGVQDSGQRLGAFQQAIQEATQRFTAEKAEERFIGHITLGRINHLSRNDMDALARTAGRFSETSFGEWRARELQLMRSELSSEGVHHKLLVAFPLTDP
jgi:2'-5' RNA ligase